MTTPGRPISARDLNAAAAIARSAHPAAASYLAADNGDALALRNPRRAAPVPPRPSAPRLFDLCFKRVPEDTESPEFGIYLFVGFKEYGSSLCEPPVRVNGRTVECQWAGEDGEWDPDSPWQRVRSGYRAAPTDGTAVWIVFGIISEDWDARKWAAAANGGTVGNLFWTPVVGTLASPPNHPYLPSGAANQHYMHPVLVGFWKDGVGLVQCHAGPVEITVEVPDTDAAGMDVPERKSLERASDATLAVRGWTDPEACPSLALTGTDGKAAAGASDNSLLVRSSLSAGDSIRMRYLGFADLLAALDRRFPRKGTPLDGEGGDDPIEAVYNLTCPTEHDRTTPLVYFFNPCDLLDDQGNVLQRAGLQHGQFWVTGGDATTCRGVSIGDVNGTVKIVFNPAQGAPSRLMADWEVFGSLRLYDGLRLGPSSQAALFGQTLAANDGTSVVVAANGQIPTLAAASTVSALAARVSAAENSLSGLEALLSQI